MTEGNNRSESYYLDVASAAPVATSARQAYVEALEVFGNPSSPHAEGEKAHVLLEESRKTIARLAEVKPDCVLFTSGATEANALAIQGHIKALVASGKRLEDLHLLYLPTAHSSVVDTCKSLGAQGVQVEELVVTDYAVDLAALKKQIRPETVLVSMDLVCGETGTIYKARDVRRVLDAARKENRNNRVLLHVDASQAPLTEHFELIRLGTDLLTLDAQKVGGVRGTGALIRANTLILLAPLMQGGGQEQGIRPGTENVAGAAAFAAALSEVAVQREEFKKRASEARTAFLETLSTAFPDMLVNSGKDTAPHILNISFAGRDTDYAVMLLSKAGFYASTKSACETVEIGSRVVFAFTGDTARSLATLRISWGPATPADALPKLAKEIIRTISFLDAHAL